MPESYQSILQRYINTQIVNPRKSAEFFGGLASQGSVAAAFTAGLLNARADQADAIQNQLAAALQDQKLQLDAQQVKNQTDRVPYQNYSDYQSGKLQGANADYRGVETGLLRRYGGQKTLADIANTDANTYQSYVASDAAMANAETGRITAVSNAKLNNANISALDLRTSFERQYGDRERKAGIDNIYANIGVAQQNADTASMNAKTSQSQANTQFQYNAGQWWQNQQELGLKRQELRIRERELSNPNSTNAILNASRQQQIDEANQKALIQSQKAAFELEKNVLTRFQPLFNRTGKTASLLTDPMTYGRELTSDTRSLSKVIPNLTKTEMPIIQRLLIDGYDGMKPDEVNKAMDTILNSMTPDEIQKRLENRLLDVEYQISKQKAMLGE